MVEQESKKIEMVKLIDNEHGKGYSKNVNLDGYTIYRNSSFITFRVVTVNGHNVAVIEYVYVTNKNDLIKLLSFAVNFFVGKDVAYIYYKQHKRPANYVEKYFPLLDFEVQDFINKHWKYMWKSNNKYREEETIEVYL